jgi:hypothetical protein
MEDRKNLIRMANRIQDDLIKLKNNRYLEFMKRLTSFAGQLQELTAESKKMGASLVHGWFSAAERCCSRTSRLLNDISYSISQIQQLAEHPQKQTPKLSLLVEELGQVGEEFGNLDFDKAENTLSVLTEPITLEDVPLGPFRIQLELSKLSELYKDRPYRVIALDPNPAATDEEVTHPHVSGEKLCEGDGCAAIRTALEQGRLADFFIMARNILTTYNPDSPYVSLDDWCGEPCYECGYVTSSDNSYYCSFCDHASCEECTTYCRSCDESICVGCAARCEICEEPVCPRCARIRCVECECVCCESCIEERLCPNCKEEKENEDEEQTEQITGANENRVSSKFQTSNPEIKLTS